MERELINGVSLILAVAVVIGAWIAVFYLMRHIDQAAFSFLYKAVVGNGWTKKHSLGLGTPPSTTCATFKYSESTAKSLKAQIEAALVTARIRLYVAQTQPALVQTNS